jgi:hypothetical protein
MDREAAKSRLYSAAYVAREAGLDEDEILETVRAGVAEAAAKWSHTDAALAEYRDRRGRHAA